MKMNASTINELTTEFKNTVSDLEKKYGVEFELGNVKYNANNFITTLTVSNVNEGGVATTPIAENLERLRTFKNIPSQFKVGTIFRYNGKTFTLIGYDTKKRKFPVIAESGGDRYKLPESVFSCAVVKLD